MKQALVTEKQNKLSFIIGIGLTLFIAILAKYLGQFPIFTIMGQLVIAILLGIGWKAIVGVPQNVIAGTNFSSRKLLRLGIILLGMRLNLVDILHAGPKIFAIAVINSVFTLFVVYGLTRLFKVEKRLGILTACGTAICGAAAIVVIAPQIKANDDETAIGAATAAILGTIFTLVYTIFYPVSGLSAYGYGIFSGATLHEIAHVIAAADPIGKKAVDIAVIVKLTRVALLVPVAILIGIWTNRSSNRFPRENESKTSFRSIPVPWFIVGFLAMSALNSTGIVSVNIANQIILIAYMLIAMAMAGLGLNVDVKTIRRHGLKLLGAGFIGSILLSVLGYLLVYAFHLM